ncbi:T9SS type A sorting domain-containing protein [Fulvivirgaceae bacterium BMA10]|uniref:T9SS type A sorting domain-containing protein n=1 Tax=Splendidivirga corallicola TaxID=3051826 RepID=A0ABT8KSM4_9BACT|nr:T9SS type A sorting domain-containing protein [Fulvivirgaceae bacterium BMA10]
MKNHIINYFTFIMLLGGMISGNMLFAQQSINNIVIGGHFQQWNGCGNNSTAIACASPWKPSHGFPYVYPFSPTQVPCLPLTSGPAAVPAPCFERWAMLWPDHGGNGNSVGFFQYIAFKKGVSYKLKFRAMYPWSSNENTPSHFSIAIANNVPECTDCGTTSGTTVKPSISELQVILDETFDEVNEVWKDFEITFIPDRDYEQLWLYSDEITQQTTLKETVALDDIEIVLNCVNNKYHQNTSDLPLLTKASDFITAGSNVGPNPVSGDVTVESGQDVIFEANNDIFLKPGFRAKNGGIFHALTIDCSNTTSPLNIVNTGSSGPTAFTLSPDHAKQEDIIYPIEAFPNPTNSLTTFKYSITNQGNVKLYLMNTTGKKIYLVNEAHHNTGRHQVEFDMNRLKSGLYIYTLESPDGRFTKKIIVGK